MWNKALAAILTVGVIGTISSVGASANEASDAAVAKDVPAAKVSLQQGLTAAESQGRPISGKYEADNGRAQLSVYTVKDGKFSEVLVDQNTGKVEKSEAITGSDDLAHAQSQMEACSKSKISLKSAVDRAEMKYGGYRAVSVTPKLTNGHPFAIVSLVQRSQLRSIAEPLD